MAEMDEANETYAHFHAGERLLTGGNVAQAIVRLEKARRLDPDKSSIRETLGRAYYAVGRWPDAEVEFRAIIERYPADDYAHYCLSRALWKMGRDAEAATHLRLARAMRPPDQRDFTLWV